MRGGRRGWGKEGEEGMRSEGKGEREGEQNPECMVYNTQNHTSNLFLLHSC